MSSYWANFAATGKPNGAGLPQWPAYTVAEKQIMVFGEKARAGTLPDGAALDFLYCQMVKD